MHAQSASHIRNKEGGPSMTVRWGKCLNYRHCKDAKDKQHIPIPQGARFVCPECSEPLVDENAVVPFDAPAAPVTSGKPRKKSPNTFLIAVAALLVLAAVAVCARWYLQHTAKAATSKTILRLAGSNTIGDTL